MITTKTEKYVIHINSLKLKHALKMIYYDIYIYLMILAE